jgi:hypothetical protein
LKTTRIRDDSESMFDQIEHFEITHGLEHAHSIHFESGRFKAQPGPRVRREYDWPLERNLAQHICQKLYPVGVIDI